MKNIFWKTGIITTQNDFDLKIHAYVTATTGKLELLGQGKGWKNN